MSKSATLNTTPWIEKFRPKVFDELVLTDNVKSQLMAHLAEGKLHHLILNGEPGVGKTSSVKCIARYLLGENMKDGFLELNASDDRGIKTISMILGPFCKKRISYNGPKIILLDEADNITPKAQNEISNLMREFGTKTKFIFTCNTVTKINEYIQSDASTIYFRRFNIINF